MCCFFLLASQVCLAQGQLQQLKAELESAVALTQEALAWIPAPHPAPVRAALQYSTADGESSGGPARHASGADSAACSHLDCAIEHVRAGSSVKAHCAVDSATQDAVIPQQRGMQLSPPAVPCGRPDEDGAAPACFAPDSKAPQGRDIGRQRSSVAGNNARIHPRCRYAEREPDFAALAQRFPALRPYVRGAPGGRGKIDFTDSAAARCASAAWPCWSWNGLPSLARDCIKNGRLQGRWYCWGVHAVALGEHACESMALQ